MLSNITTRNPASILSFLAMFLLILLFIPSLATAQIVPRFGNVIVLKVSPTNPGPREQVTIYAESFSIDLNTATVSWFINDILQRQSVGGTVFQFVTEDLGSSTKIDVVAEVSRGSLEAEQITIRPTDIDILWQAQTFAHPLYKGKRIASVGSSIRIEVVPHFINNAGKKLKVNELIYLWRVDNKTLPRASGRGKNTITISQTKPIGSIFIEVEVESSDKILFGKRSVLIPVRDSELFVYENNPLLGILFNKAINGLYSLIGQETKFIVYPFFMSLVNRNASHINYSWKLNNDPITLGEDRGSITVSHTSGEGVEAEISVSVENSRDIFQRSASKFKIKLEGKSLPTFGF